MSPMLASLQSRLPSIGISMLASGLVHAADEAEKAANWAPLVIAVAAAIAAIVAVLQARGRLRRAGELVAESRNELRRSEEQNRVLARDISERKRVEGALRSGEELLRQVTENLDTAFWLMSVDGRRFVYVSPAYDEVFGQPRRQALEKPDAWLEFVHPEDRAQLAAQLPTAGESVMDAEYRVQRSDGTIGKIRTRAYPIIADDGSITRIVGMSEDVTRSTYTHDGSTLERLRADVEQAAGDRRNLEEQLRNAQRMEAIGLLTAGVANDFNNLLAIITSHGETHMGKLAAQDPRRRNVEQMLKAAKQAATLTHQLLAFSRQHALPTVLVDFNHLVTDLDRNCRYLVGDNIELVTRLAADLGHVQADPGQMNQVLTNLVANARESMPEGGTLTIETANVELDEIYTRLHMAVKPGWCVMLSVTDTGRGMDSATQARIFEPFFGTTDTGAATGLGLATVYSIVKQSGGNIWFSSEPGKGTTFKVYLPRVDAAIVSATGEGRVVGASGTETILLVEDEIDVRELINEMLVSDGYRVIEAGNGEEALAACQANPGAINLVMTDIVMPHMNGPELAEQIGKLCPEVKILYMSGYMDQAIVNKGVVDPTFMFLEKPFTAALLLRKVREALDHPKAGAE